MRKNEKIEHLANGRKLNKKKTHKTQHLATPKKVYRAEESMFTVPTRSESSFQRTDAHFKVKILNQRVLPSKLSHNISSVASACLRPWASRRAQESAAERVEKRVLPLQPDRVHLLFLTTAPLTFFFFFFPHPPLWGGISI